MDHTDETADWPPDPGDDGLDTSRPATAQHDASDPATRDASRQSATDATARRALPETSGRGAAGLPGVGRITLGKRGELACKAVLVVVGALYAVLMWVSYTNARTALLEAGEPEHLAELLPLGFDVAGTVLVALSLVLAAKESRGQLVTRVYGIVLVVVSAGIGAWYGRAISGAAEGGSWFDWINWFVAAHALMAVTLAVFAESVAWLLRARIDAAIGVERVPMVLCLTNPGAWREANTYRLRHRSPVSSALVMRSEKIKAVSRVVEAAQEDAGYKGAKAQKVRAAIMRACRDGTLPVEAIERACETGMDETASRRLLVDAAKAMMASTANDAISGTDPLTELLGGHDGGSAEDGRRIAAPALDWAAVGLEDERRTAGKFLDRGHNVSDEQMSEILASVEKATGKPLSISEIAHALSIGKARATTIRSITPKPNLKGRSK